MRLIKNKSERKKEILSVAKTVFLQKGFDKTTMEDIVAGTSLSKGGVYYYYNNTVDIFHDLMVEGIQYRRKMISDRSKYPATPDKDALAAIVVDKILDQSDFMSLYVMYLQAARHNTSLRNLFETLKRENYEMLKGTFGEAIGDAVDSFYSDFMIDFTNTIMLGAELLGARSEFRKNREILIAMVKVALEKLEDRETGT